MGMDSPEANKRFSIFPIISYPCINPIITNIFTADPSAHVWEENGRIYIYASHDMMPAKGCGNMDKYHVYSSDNMVTWKDEG